MYDKHFMLDVVGGVSMWKGTNTVCGSKLRIVYTRQWLLCKMSLLKNKQKCKL